MLSDSQVFLVRKVTGSDAGQLYAMKVLKKATLKGKGPGKGWMLETHLHSVPLELKETLVLLSLRGFRSCSQRRAPGTSSLLVTNSANISWVFKLSLQSFHRFQRRGILHK